MSPAPSPPATDLSYDGEVSESGLEGGLGQLVDGVTVEDGTGEKELTIFALWVTKINQ